MIRWLSCVCQSSSKISLLFVLVLWFCGFAVTSHAWPTPEDVWIFNACLTRNVEPAGRVYFPLLDLSRKIERDSARRVPMSVPTSHSSKPYNNFWISLGISNQYCLILINKVRVWPRGLVVHVFKLENWYKSPCIVKTAHRVAFGLPLTSHRAVEINNNNHYFIIRRVIAKGNPAVRLGPYLLFFPI